MMTEVAAAMRGGMLWPVRAFCIGVALCVLDVAPAQAQPALLPVPQPGYGQIKSLLDREIDAVSAATEPHLIVTLAVTYAMLGDVDRAAELSTRLPPVERHIGTLDEIDEALAFQGALTLVRAHTRRDAAVGLETAASILEERRQITPFQDRVREQLEKAVEQARARLTREDTFNQANVLFADGKFAEALRTLDRLEGEQGNWLRFATMDAYARILALRGDPDKAVELVAGGRGTPGLNPWRVAQLLAFRGEADLAHRVADGIEDEETWRGAKLGIALAMARRREIANAKMAVREVLNNRGRPLAPGALSRATLLPLVETHTYLSGLTASNPKSPLRLFVRIQPGRWSFRVAPVAVVAINLFDEGELEGAREMMRAFAASVAAEIPAHTRPVPLFSSIARRLAEFGDREGAEQALETMERYSSAATDKDRYGLAKLDLMFGEFIIETLVRLYGFDATWKVIEEAGIGRGRYFYCRAVQWAIHTNVPLDDVERRLSANQSIECRGTIVTALAAAGRYEDLRRAFPRVGEPLADGIPAHLGYILLDAPPSRATADTLIQLLDRCARANCPPGRTGNPPVWTMLLAALARQEGVGAELKRAIAQ